MAMKLRPIVNLLLTAATASLLGSCAMDDILQQYTGTEIAFRPSLGMPGARSAEVGIGQLKDTELLVTAIDQHGDTYFKDVVFRNEDPDSPTPLFTSDQKYYWPGDGSQLRFTAYPKSYADRGLIDPNSGVLTYKPMSSWYKDEMTDGDGSTFLSDGTTIDINNIVRLPDGEIIYPDGTIQFASNSILHTDGTIEVEHTTYDYDGADFEYSIKIDNDRNIYLYDHTYIDKQGYAHLPCGVIACPNGNLKLTDGTIVTRNDIGTQSDGTTIEEDGSVTLPDGSYLPPMGVYEGTGPNKETKLFPGVVLYDASDYHSNYIMILEDGIVKINYSPWYGDEDASIGTDGEIYFRDGEHLHGKGTKKTIEFSAFETAELCGDISLADEDFNITTIKPDRRIIMPDGEIIIPGALANLNEHTDIVMAHATGNKDNIAGLPLLFKHKLSQVEIWAVNKNPVYQYDIVNVKIANIKGEGSISSIANAEWSVNPTFIQTYKPTLDYIYKYFSIINDKRVGKGHSISLELNASTLLSDPNPYFSTRVEGTHAGQLYGSLMVLPQELTPWNKTAIANEGAYIAVKLRITTNLGAFVYPPENPVKSNQEFAWVAVPLSGKWEAGNKYVYTLDFTNGAGYSDPDEGNPHLVLNGEFKFNCTVIPRDAEEHRPTDP